MDLVEKYLGEQKIGKPLVRDIIGFIDARHMGDVKTAMQLHKKLKKKLGSSFSKTLMMHGDPDDPQVGYTMVRNKWSALL